MLIELELDNSDVAFGQRGGLSSNGGRALNATDQFNQRMGLDALSITDVPDLADGMMDRMIDEVPVFEVDGSFYDPAVTKHVSRLAHPVLLTVTILPPPSRPQTPNTEKPSDPVIVRRRMELLASDSHLSEILHQRERMCQHHGRYAVDTNVDATSSQV